MVAPTTSVSLRTIGDCAMRAKGVVAIGEKVYINWPLVALISPNFQVYPTVLFGNPIHFYHVRKYSIQKNLAPMEPRLLQELSVIYHHRGNRGRNAG